MQLSTCLSFGPCDQPSGLICSAPAPSPVGGKAFAVRQLLVLRRRSGVCDWEGYGPEEHSWVPAHFVLEPSLVSDLLHRHPDLLPRLPGGGHWRGDTVIDHSGESRDPNHALWGFRPIELPQGEEPYHPAYLVLLVV